MRQADPVGGDLRPPCVPGMLRTWGTAQTEAKSNEALKSGQAAVSVWSSMMTQAVMGCPLV